METIHKLLEPIGGTAGLGLIATWAGIALVYLRRRMAWSRKQFRDQVNFSLNYVANGSLAIRTVMEARALAVWLNEYGVNILLAAAKRTTVDRPFLQLGSQSDMDFVNRAVKNALSERFAAAFIGEALGAGVRSGTFVFGVTYERYDDLRTQKLRVLLIKEQTLSRLFGLGCEGEKLPVTNPLFLARLKTLKALHDLYVESRLTGVRVVDRVHLGVVA